MQNEHRAYKKAFKIEAVRLVQTSGKSISQVAEDLCISDSNLSCWCREQEGRGEQAFVGSGHQTAQEEELRRLKRELDLVRQERDILKDVFSRMVVGWAMAATEDARLFERALRLALGRREPQADLLHHCDQGSEETSDAYLAVLKSWGIQLSMSRTGNCYDNAVMERFFGTLKRECPMDFETHQQARSAIFEYIECFYNRVRRHSTLDYLSPVDFELSKR